MDYTREIARRNAAISELQDKIAALEAELDQLWRDEAIASIDHEIPLDAWNRPKPILCRKCRKEPALTATKQRQVDAVVEGRLVKVWQDYYVYSLTDGELWGKKCSDAYLEEIRKRREHEAWLDKYEREHPNDYHGGC